MKGNKEKLEGIRNDLIQGKEYEIVAKKWGVSERYIQNLASVFREQGYDVPKQGSEEFKRVSFLVYKKVQNNEYGKDGDEYIIYCKQVKGIFSHFEYR